MKFLILTVNQDLESIQQLTRILQSHNTEYKIEDPFKMDQDQFLTTKYDCVLNRVSGISYNDGDLELLKNYQKRWPKALIVNNPEETALFRDKALQADHYIKNQIPTIATVSLEQLDSLGLVQFTADNPSDKYLFKPVRSNQAKGIIICDDPLKTFTELQSKGDLRYILQPLILKQAEWRVLILKDEILGFLKKDSLNGEELLNCDKANLTHIKDQEIPEELLVLINKVTNHNNLYLQALDILVEKDETLRLIEVNNVPGFKFFEKTTGISPSKLLVQRIFDDLRS
jgi:glutathione synthase/RimK-type ligase-like ATP-grasp enzyme